MKTFTDKKTALKQAASKANESCPYAVTWDGDRYYSVEYERILTDPDFHNDDVIEVFGV